MKQKVKEIALETGGSHYPEVGGELLQSFADKLIAECIDAVNNADCKSFVYTNFDKDRELSVKERCVIAIKDRFK